MSLGSCCRTTSSFGNGRPARHSKRRGRRSWSFSPSIRRRGDPPVTTRHCEDHSAWAKGSPLNLRGREALSPLPYPPSGRGSVGRNDRRSHYPTGRSYHTRPSFSVICGSNRRRAVIVSPSLSRSSDFLVAQFEHRHIRVRAWLERADCAFIAHDLRRHRRRAPHHFVQRHAEMQQLGHRRGQVPNRPAASRW